MKENKNMWIHKSLRMLHMPKFKKNPIYSKKGLNIFTQKYPITMITYKQYKNLYACGITFCFCSSDFFTF